MPRLWPCLLLCPLLAACGPTLQQSYENAVSGDTKAHPAPAPRLLQPADLKRLPEPVRRYVLQSGAVGKPVPWNFRATADAVMRKQPGARPIPAGSEQVNYYSPSSRAFFMRARMFGLPVKVLHHYWDGQAGMTVRALGLFTVADVQGADLFKAECVTVLNDLCVFAPGRLAEPDLAWKTLDAHSAEVAFSNQGLTVKAVLHFNAQGELVNFVSDDRLALQDDGSLKSYRFSTPLSDYQDFGGIRLARKGDAVWHYPEGNFAYGSFVLKGIEYNVTAP